MFLFFNNSKTIFAIKCTRITTCTDNVKFPLHYSSSGSIEVPRLLSNISSCCNTPISVETSRSLPRPYYTLHLTSYHTANFERNNPWQNKLIFENINGSFCVYILHHLRTLSQNDMVFG